MSDIDHTEDALNEAMAALKEMSAQLAAEKQRADDLGDKLDSVCGQLETLRRAEIRTADLRAKLAAAEARTADVEQITILKHALKRCAIELAYIIMQTDAKEGGSIWKAHQLAVEVLENDISNSDPAAQLRGEG